VRDIAEVIISIAHEFANAAILVVVLPLAPAPFEVIDGIAEKRDCPAFRNGAQNAPSSTGRVPHAGFEPPLYSLSSACTIIRTTSGMV
jgi:hypothetical protein